MNKSQERTKEIEKKLKELNNYLCGEILECEGATAAYKSMWELQKYQNKVLIRANKNLKIELRDAKNET